MHNKQRRKQRQHTTQPRTKRKYNKKRHIQETSTSSATTPTERIKLLENRRPDNVRRIRFQAPKEEDIGKIETEGPWQPFLPNARIPKMTHVPTYRNPEERQRYQYAISRKDGACERNLRLHDSKNQRNNTPDMHHDEENE